MNNTLEDLIKRQNPAIGDLVEQGIGFRIGSPEFEFTLDGQSDNRWTHVDREHGLKVESQVQRGNDYFESWS